MNDTWNYYSCRPSIHPSIIRIHEQAIGWLFGCSCCRNPYKMKQQFLCCWCWYSHGIFCCCYSWCACVRVCCCTCRCSCCCTLMMLFVDWSCFDWYLFDCNSCCCCYCNTCCCSCTRRDLGRWFYRHEVAVAVVVVVATRAVQNLHFDLYLVG